MEFSSSAPTSCRALLATRMMIIIALSLETGVMPLKLRACEEACTCTNERITCRRSEIDEVPMDLKPKTIAELAIINTKMTRIEEEDFEGLEQLTVLYLNDNRINFIHTRSFRNMYRLNLLSLENNRLTSLDPRGLIFQHLPSLNYTNLMRNSISSMNRYTFFTSVSTPNVNRISMSGNPVQCKCDVLAIKNWIGNLGRNANRISFSDLRCANDPSNRLYTSVSTNLFGNCQGETPTTTPTSKSVSSKEENLSISPRVTFKVSTVNGKKNIDFFVNGEILTDASIIEAYLSEYGDRWPDHIVEVLLHKLKEVPATVPPTLGTTMRSEMTRWKCYSLDLAGEIIKTWVEETDDKTIETDERTICVPLNSAGDDEDGEIDDSSKYDGSNADVFSTMVACPQCDRLRTNHACNSRPNVSCTGLQMVCLKTVNWNDATHTMELSSRCERYESCLDREARNVDRCGIGYQSNGNVECEFCCIGPTCQEDSFGGRTYDLTFFLSYTRNQGAFETWMVIPTSQTYKNAANKIEAGLRSAIVSVKGGVDVYLYSFETFSSTQHNVTVQLEFTVLTSQSEYEVREMIERDLGTSVLSNQGYLYQDNVVPTSILLTRNKTTSTPDLLFCVSETTKTSKGTMAWPRTRASTTYNLACPVQTQERIRYARRVCILGTSPSGESVYWGDVQDGDCAPAPPATTPASIEDVLDVDISPDNAAEISQTVEKLTERVSDTEGDTPGSLTWTPKAVEQVVDVLEQLVKPDNLKQEGVVDNVVMSLSNLLEADEDVMRSAQNDGDTSKRIVDVIDKISEEAPLNDGKLKVVTPNLAVAAQGITSGVRQNVALTASPDLDDDDSMDSSQINVELTDRQPDEDSSSTALVLPLPAILDTLNNEQKQRLERASFVVHRSDKLFAVPNSGIAVQTMQQPGLVPADSTDQDATLRVSDGTNKDNSDDKKDSVNDDTSTGRYYVKINSLVVSASVPGVKVENLSENITMVFQHRKDNATNPRCVFWDELENDWSSEGCGVVTSSVGVTQCGCNHLTNFALLMDVYQEGTGLSSLDRKILSYISYIGCGVSLAALLLTLLTYVLFRKLRRDNPSKILINLCLALLVSNLIYLVGMHDYSFDNKNVCKVVAVLLHYFLLSSLCWMAVEAFYMYLALILVFKTYFTNFLLKCSLVGWGIPLVTVVVTLAIDSTDNYGFINSGMCWLRNPAFYVAFVGPVCLILLINFITFGMVIKQLSNMASSKLNKSDRNNTVQRLRGAIGVVILLGLTWIFAVFAIGEASKVFYYLFAIFNSLQGLFIFIFYCLLKKDAMTAWKRVLPCFDEHGDTSKTSSNSKGASQSVTNSNQVGEKYRNTSGTTSGTTLHGTSSNCTVSTSADSRKNSTTTILNNQFSTIEDSDLYSNLDTSKVAHTPSSVNTTTLAAPPVYPLANGSEKPYNDNYAFQRHDEKVDNEIYENCDGVSDPPPSPPTPAPYPAATNAQSFYAPPFSFRNQRFQNGQHWQIPQKDPIRGGGSGEVDSSSTARVSVLRVRYDRSSVTSDKRVNDV